MGRSANKKQRNKQELKSLAIQKRQALIRLAMAIVGFIVYVAVEQALIFNGVLDGSSPVTLIVTFLFAVVMAAVAGLATRDWSSANRRIQQIQQNLKK